MNQTIKQHFRHNEQFAAWVLTLATVALLASPLAGAQGSSVASKPDAAGRQLMKFSKEGNRAVREIGAARIAIFNGEIKAAIRLMDKAKADVAVAAGTAAVYSVKATITENGRLVAMEAGQIKAGRVPVDGQIVLPDEFADTPEKMARIAKADEAFRTGNQMQAIDELRRGDIDVRFNRLMMPLVPTQQRLDEAMKLAQRGKCYEANLALKAIEDSLVLETVAIVGGRKDAGFISPPRQWRKARVMT